MTRLWIIRDERIWWALRDHLEKAWKPASHSGKPLAIEISTEKAQRTSQQNKRLHAILKQISEQVWIGGRQFAPKEWKEMFKLEFLPTIDLPNGKIMSTSTTTLDPKEFNEFMEQVEAYAAVELGIQILEVA